MEAVDVAVVGGGVIGCSVAYHAARRGARVALFEAERVGSGASGAAAGMLAAQAEAHGSGPFLDLLLRSRDMHGPLGEELREETGLDPEHVWAGTLRAVTDAGGEEVLKERYSWQKDLDLPVRYLTGDEARELEPALSPAVSAALYHPADGQVNSPRLVQALALAAVRKGAEIKEFERVIGFVHEDGRVAGVRTTQETVPAGAVVLAGGIAGAALPAELGLRSPVYPIKGEILSASARPAPLTANVWGDGCYVVPKSDGRVVIGATEEPDIHDRRPTLGGLSQLSSAAVDLIPALHRAPFLSAWGGLRPATPSGHPILGPVEGHEGLLLATGHYRNGVLLAPITGEAIAALALADAPPVDLRPFAPEVLVARGSP